MSPLEWMLTILVGLVVLSVLAAVGFVGLMLYLVGTGKVK